MREYTLEIKQIVDYPRCRIYRQFVQALIADRSIRVSGGSGLFYFVVLCAYANFRTSYKRIDGISYTIYPGEWIMSVEELSRYFRTRFRRQTLAALEGLQKKGLISFLVLGHGKLVKFKIRGWRRHNTILDYNAPCQKDTGFFFFPVSTATELVSAGHCSEMENKFHFATSISISTARKSPIMAANATTFLHTFWYGMKIIITPQDTARSIRKSALSV